MWVGSSRQGYIRNGFSFCLSLTATISRALRFGRRLPFTTFSEQYKLLKHHVANKKIPFIGPDGNLVTPTEPNGIKLELFVFDVFKFSDSMGVLQVDRNVEFSPLKNASSAGKDCVDTCRAMTYALNRSFLNAAGAKFVDASGEPLAFESLGDEHVCEISPLVSYAGEGLEDYVKANSPLKFPIQISPKGTQWSL